MRINPTARTRWDELAATAAAVQDEEAAVAALGVVVLALESAAGAPRWRERGLRLARLRCGSRPWRTTSAPFPASTGTSPSSGQGLSS